MRRLLAAPARLSRTLFSVLALVLLALTAGSSAASVERGASASQPAVSVIVRETPGSGDGPELLVKRLGGAVGRHIEIINGFVAEVPNAGVARLEAAPGVHSVTRNKAVRLLSELDGWDQMSDLGSLHYVAQEVTGAGEYWNDGFTGEGVDVALIDSGVVPVNGLTTPGKIVHGPDLSFDSQARRLRHLDAFGHGTHMAGIIAGRDDAVPSPVQKGEENFIGMAPDARIVSVKVADALGRTDVSQVIAAIDWVVQHRRDNGLNIRVLNLSFGTDGEQDYRVDPLAYAVEVAWRKGIVVVVAAGNGGYGSEKLNNPAYDPFVIAVGGADGQGTYDPKDDVVQPWSSASGDDQRHPDLVAPGKSIASLRAPGSFLDSGHPEARVGDTPRFFRGSGTSQAAAVVSGAAALIIEQRPDITPNQVKRLLKQSAAKLLRTDENAQGDGMLDLKEARDRETPTRKSSTQSFQASTGTGSLELARGSSHVSANGTQLSGEQDIFRAPFASAQWAAKAAAESSWSGGQWNGNRWTGDGWSSAEWSSAEWSSAEWSSAEWSSAEWSSAEWSSAEWSSAEWSSAEWSSAEWSSAEWSSAEWSSAGWH